MICYVKATYEMQNGKPVVKFTQLQGDYRYYSDIYLGENTIKIANTWLLTKQDIQGIPEESNPFLAICYLGNADKPKIPLHIFQTPAFGQDDYDIFMLKSSPISFSVTKITPTIFEIIKKHNVSTVIPVTPGKSVNIISVYIDGECVNPVISIAGYVEKSPIEIENGFIEMYYTATEFAFDRSYPEDKSRYILQKSGVKDETVLYYDLVHPVLGFESLLQN